ncbi:uncharacterized protein LOC141823491 [Curcuma longa]|uniref:uncharacterized protein LOC141823491 n=1 Tax=Curcuma longa TaxID=136217 RepID=UPI003D9DE5D4
MKIFLNWMHRKLHPMGVAKYSQVPQKKGEEAEEIAEMVAAEEKEALLLHDMLGGILTIGTLGQYQNPFLPSEEASRFDEEEEHEEAPLIVAVEEKEEEEDKATVTLKEREIVLLQEDLPLLKEDLERRERARTTLADLFAADSAAREDANVNKGIKNTSNSSSKQSHKTKKKEEEKKTTTTMQSPLRDTTKACCSNGKNSCSSSNSKLQKLMTRMLKKKIHPESITSAGAAAAKSINTRDDVSRNGVVYW